VGFALRWLDMVTHMKTTIDIADALLLEAKQIAAQHHVTLRELVEEGLRHTLSVRKQRVPFKLRDASFKGGKGLQPEVAGLSWDKILDMAYEGRGA
jgi:hypothetical protein